ncbi:DUF6232 family protein [Shewanella seohaensis]|uniref:DUF6232 family protein n=1 Tax=Shewanella seohaensis TaxID=755175 RepID=A0ABV4VXH4_9GAMM
MEEKTFFNKGNVMVTNSRFVVSGQTYAMSNVTSVKSGEIPGSQALSLIIAVMSVPFFISGGGSIFIGIALLAAAFFAATKVKSTYTVILNTSAGENKALSSKDKGYVSSIIRALNDAIVSRG